MGQSIALTWLSRSLVEHSHVFSVSVKLRLGSRRKAQTLCQEPVAEHPTDAGMVYMLRFPKVRSTEKMPFPPPATQLPHVAVLQRTQQNAGGSFSAVTPRGNLACMSLRCHLPMTD